MGWVIISDEHSSSSNSTCLCEFIIIVPAVIKFCSLCIECIWTFKLETVAQNRYIKALSLPKGEYPSCLHTTLASMLSQKSSQMVPQVPLTHTSTLPMFLMEFPLIRRSPCGQSPKTEAIYTCKNISTGHMYND